MNDYDKLKALLAQQNFPLVFPFKFVIKKDQDKLVEIKRVFDETAEFSVRESKNGNYISITIKQMMLQPDHIIEKYEQMKKIKGIISL